MKKLLKIIKLDSGFLVEDKEGHQFFYASSQEVANEILKIFNNTDSKELSVITEWAEEQRIKVKEIIKELTRLRNGGSYNPDKTSEAIAKAIETIEDWKARRFRQDLVKAINTWRG